MKSFWVLLSITFIIFLNKSYSSDCLKTAPNFPKSVTSFAQWSSEEIIKQELLDVKETVQFFKEHLGHTEVICTGRGAPTELIEIADLITDMENKKHYFFAGIESRDGIDHWEWGKLKWVNQ